MPRGRSRGRWSTSPRTSPPSSVSSQRLRRCSSWPGRTTQTGRPDGGADHSPVSPPSAAMVDRIASMVDGGAGCHEPEVSNQPSSMPQASVATAQSRSEERREGKEGVSTCRYGWTPHILKKKTNKTYDQDH